MTDDEGYSASLSALLGGGIAVIATLCLGIRMFAVDRRSSPKQILRAFYLAEIWRLAAVVMAFAGIFSLWDGVRALWLLLAFALGMLAHGAALLFPMESR